MKRWLSIHFRKVLLCVTVGLLSGSCIYDRTEGDDSLDERDDKVQFVFRISAGKNSAPQQPADIVEIVKSLRVIVIDQSGRLDVNEKVPLPMPETAAKDFSHIFTRFLKSGDKRVFLVANEESAGAVFLTGSTGIPAGLPLTNLTAMLDYFKADPENRTTSDHTGDTFADLLNRVYFKNDYSRMSDGTAIALPYSACYEVEMSSLPGQPERPMYLVPAAAKFDFEFTNYRRSDAYVDDIILSSLNSHNYLNAQLADSEKRRNTPYGATDMWWIDWLEACARDSQNAENPNLVNEKWGWITDYRMPVPDEKMRDLSLKGEEVWRVEQIVDMSKPSKLSLGPFYVPESFNPSRSEPGIAAKQSYSLTFKVHDDAETEVTTLSGNMIDPLKALFRATHIIIHVQFYEREAEIYAEIVPWTEKTFSGYVQQDEDF